jgi:hypothetical protein
MARLPTRANHAVVDFMSVDGAARSGFWNMHRVRPA